MSGQEPNKQISLYFHDDSIASAFGVLIASLGFQAKALKSLSELATAQKIITEPMFFEELSEEQKGDCLLVGNQYTSSDLGCPIIRQPLTPMKIQEGLQAFLGEALSH